jgi:hypothetical protein
MEYGVLFKRGEEVVLPYAGTWLILFIHNRLIDKNAIEATLLFVVQFL